MGKYIAWLNVQLRLHDTRIVWQSDIVTDMVSTTPVTQTSLAHKGLSRDLRAQGTEARTPTADVAEARHHNGHEVVCDEVPLALKGLS